MYSIVNTKHIYSTEDTKYQVQDFDIYVGDSKVEVVKQETQQIENCLFFEKPIKIYSPLRLSRFLLFSFNDFICIYDLGMCKIEELSFVDITCIKNVYEVNEDTFITVGEHSVILYSYQKRRAIESYSCEIEHFQENRHEGNIYLLINEKILLSCSSTEIKLSQCYETECLDFKFFNNTIITIEKEKTVYFVENGLNRLIFKLKDEEIARLKVTANEIYLCIDEELYSIDKSLRSIEVDEKEQDNQEHHFSCTLIAEYLDYEVRSNRILPLFLTESNSELLLSSITATKQLSLPSNHFTIAAFLSTGNYEVFCESYYNEKSNESIVNLFGMQEFDTFEELPDLFIFGRVVSLGLFFDGTAASCTVLTDESIYVYEMGNNELSCFDYLLPMEFVVEIEEKGEFIGIQKGKYYLIDIIDGIKQECEVRQEVANQIMKKGFVMYSILENSKIMLPTDFSIGEVMQIEYSNFDECLIMTTQYYELRPVIIINFINEELEKYKTRQNQKRKNSNEEVRTDETSNLSTTSALTDENTDLLVKMQRKLYEPNLQMLKEKYLEMSNQEILMETMNKTAVFSNFEKICVNDDTNFYYYSEISLCLFHTCKKYNAYVFDGRTVEEFCYVLQLLIPVVLSLGKGKNNTELAEVVGEYMGIDSFRLKDLNNESYISINKNNWMDIYNYEHTYSLLITFQIIYFLELVNDSFDNFYLFKLFETTIQEYCSDEDNNISLQAVFDILCQNCDCSNYSATTMMIIYFNTECRHCRHLLDDVVNQLLVLKPQVDKLSDIELVNYFIVAIISLTEQLSYGLNSAQSKDFYIHKSFLRQVIQNIFTFLRNKTEVPVIGNLMTELETLILLLSLEFFTLQDIFKDKHDDLNERLTVVDFLVVCTLAYAEANQSESEKFFIHEEICKFLITLPVIRCEEFFKFICVLKDKRLCQNFENLITFIKNKYPALLEYYGDTILLDLIPLEEQLFEQSIIEESAGALLKQFLRIVGSLTKACNSACTFRVNGITRLMISTKMEQILVFEYEEYTEHEIYCETYFELLKVIHVLETDYILGFSHEEMSIFLFNNENTEGIVIPMLELREIEGILKSYELQNKFTESNYCIFLCYKVTPDGKIIIELRNQELVSVEYKQQCFEIQMAYERRGESGYFKTKRGTLYESRLTKKYAISAIEDTNRIEVIIE